MERRYAIGLDYGTLSGRALLLDIDSGEEAGTAVYEYPHGVLSGTLPDGRPIRPIMHLIFLRMICLGWVRS